ncbi:polysaccharide deacetylase family protein [Fulvivirgaceae bacterium BMA10]|uniref:Polysaccharide deacetylase family protein n=1 Tax=Splendidivirga corallicola TaxID=3051826 RepID=A0ABT8KQV8_9BACT|nr:polysaccharide deacetylase family protein [Fulvivirgaceae bacterium BMA10]
MRKLIFGLLRFSGIAFLFRELLQQNKVTIVLFHDLSKKAAERNFEYLSEKYNVIGLDDLIEAHKKQDLSKIPKKALIITFDDGHIGNYEMLPVIEKINIPVTIFLCAGIINTKRHYWFKFKQSRYTSLELKHKSNQERLTALSEIGFQQDQDFEAPQALTKEQINDMKKAVNMQGHTLFHPCLPRCSDKEAKEEISESKKILEDEFGLNINALAYPNGDYSDRDIELAKDAGYTCAVTVDAGFNTLDTDLFRLKRLSVSDSDDKTALMVKASGAWAFFKTDKRKKNKFGWTDNVVR